MGDLPLTDKEATGLVIGGMSSTQVPRPRWAVVGRVCSPRRMVMGDLERAMQRAWGLHRPAQFKDLGNNRFKVRFNSEGDWRHVLRNGPWQFDLHVILLKDYDGSVRPSDMTFDSMDIWARVLDLPMDFMNRAYGELIGGWIGKYISVDVDEEGFAWGKDLRIRVDVNVNQPLLRGVTLKERNDDVEGHWFDLKYKKVPHFCFDYGRLVHLEDGCPADKEEVKQWGEWLRASPKRNQKPPTAARPAIPAGSFSGTTMNWSHEGWERATVRDLPPHRNLSHVFSQSCSSRTSGYEQWKESEELTSASRM
uniref:Uncharacterized protein n=1 Tax=Avena sativa TaxID=4498 RepID=A0ACD5X2F2_AVESA